GSKKSTAPTPPDWNEADSYRETGLLCIDDPEDREAIRRVGRLIFDMSLELTHEVGGDQSMTRAELRAVMVDLRHSAGYLAMVHPESEESDLDAEDHGLSLFAGKLAGRVAAIADAIEEQLQ